MIGWLKRRAREGDQRALRQHENHDEMNAVYAERISRDIAARISRGNVGIQMGKAITDDELEDLAKRYLDEGKKKLITRDD